MTSSIKVWDLFIRYFHWTLVIAFLVSYLTEGEYNLHFYSGLYIALLLGLRLIWGFIATRYARFSDFVRPPTEVIAYSRSFLSGKNDSNKKYLGHNPLGGLMVVSLLVSLSLTCFSGVMLYTAEGDSLFSFVEQPILQERSESDDYQSVNESEESESDAEEFWEELHELFVNVTLFLVIIHIAGVIVTGRLHKQDLIKAMITGRKKA